MSADVSTATNCASAISLNKHYGSHKVSLWLSYSFRRQRCPTVDGDESGPAMGRPGCRVCDHRQALDSNPPSAPASGDRPPSRGRQAAPLPLRTPARGEARTPPHPVALARVRPRRPSTPSRVPRKSSSAASAAVRMPSSLSPERRTLARPGRTQQRPPGKRAVSVLKWAGWRAAAATSWSHRKNPGVATCRMRGPWTLELLLGPDDVRTTGSPAVHWSCQRAELVEVGAWR